MGAHHDRQRDRLRWAVSASGRFRFTTVETKANLSRPITKDTGRVRAEARAVVRGRQIISAEAKVMSQDGKVLPHGTSTLMVLNGAK